MKKTSLILFTLIVLLIWFQITSPSFISKIKSQTIDVIKFPLKVTTKLTGKIYNFAGFQNRYEQKILMLEEEISLLSKKDVGTQEILKENQRLRSLLSFKKRVSSKTIAAEVIGRGARGLDNFIIIDKGSRDGIKVNMSVAKDQGLLGRVFEMGNNTSKITLIDNPNSKIACVIQRTREQGLLIGLGGGFCKMIYLASGTKAQPGDIVVASELSSISPKGILIGEVVKILKGPHSLYASALIRPASNLFKIEEVICIE